MPSIEELLKNSKSRKLLGDQKTAPEELGEKLQLMETKEMEDLVKEQANKLGYPYINLQIGTTAPEALAIIPPSQALNLQAVCFLVLEKVAHVGAVDPTTPDVQRLVKQIKKEKDLDSKLYLISRASLNRAIKRYQTLPRVKAKPGSIKITEQDIKKFKREIKDWDDLGKSLKKIALTDFIAFGIAGALRVDASDIHIEAEEDAVKLRYRIDGVLQDVASLPHESWPKVISRIKLIAGLKLNITDKPQDGRFTINLTNDKVDVRVSCLPTAYGESVVMRLLMSSATGLAFEDLGFSGEAFEQMEQVVNKINGLILTTGPTGSGKTTTLYAILNKLNQPDVKIITIEDPIEYKLKGINQSQTNKTRGYTFANGLRSIIRQDPDVIMVGEIRDLETAEVAIDAALTGHLVISTLHTNNASAAIPRLLSLGVKSSVLGPALNAVIAQRLVRRLCPQCKIEDKLNQETLEKISKHLLTLSSGERNRKFYTAKGCSACNNFGFKGRIGIFEIFIIDRNIQDLITKQAVTEQDLFDLATKNGMLTMVQDGLLKALDGVTSVGEVERQMGL